jgi:hypothetical protein
LNAKYFAEHEQFYADIFNLIKELEPEVFFSSDYSFMKMFKETKDFIFDFSKNSSKNYFVNKSLFMVGLMKVNQFCLKNFMLALKKNNLKSHDIFSKLNHVFLENFNAFMSKIKGMILIS